MKHVLSLFAVLGVLFIGCGGAAAASVPQPVPAADPQDAAVLLSSTVCAYPNCTDTTHFHHHAARHCRNRLSGYSAGWYRYSVPADTVQTAAQAPLFWNSMGCVDPNCTDPAHFHHCGAGCTVAGHYHSCPAGCASTGHHHGYGVAANASAATGDPAPLFWNSMGCTDPNCTDPTHFHHCDAGCTVAGHYHSCPAGCTTHNHGGWQQGQGRGHHGGGHHGGWGC